MLFRSGIACWDVNGDGVNDVSEDVNGDGNYDALDCAGADGQDGADGVACWDINGNGVGDSGEDVNGDGSFDALDCQGSDHDWYKATTTEQADAIGNNIFTQGNVGIGVNSPDKRLVVHKEDANNSGISTLLSLQKSTNSTANNGIGVGIEFKVESSDGNLKNTANINSILNDVSTTQNNEENSTLLVSTFINENNHDRVEISGNGNTATLNLIYDPSTLNSTINASNQFTTPLGSIEFKGLMTSNSGVGAKIVAAIPKASPFFADQNQWSATAEDRPTQLEFYTTADVWPNSTPDTYSGLKKRIDRKSVV